MRGDANGLQVVQCGCIWGDADLLKDPTRRSLVSSLAMIFNLLVRDIVLRLNAGHMLNTTRPAPAILYIFLDTPS